MSYPTRSYLAWCVVVGALAIASSAGHAQEDSTPRLRLTGIVPGGVRASVTESWGTLHFTVENRDAEARSARVVVFYEGQENAQFARDIWVPGNASLVSWVPVGPAPAQSIRIGRKVQVLLYDRTGGGERLLLPPTEERVRSWDMPYRSREPTTAIMLDETVPAPGDSSSTGRRDSPSALALMLTRIMRQANSMSESVSTVPPGFLPSTPATFDGIDHFVLAGNRLADDPPGQEALRRWVQQGGRLWVMLDLVDANAVAPLFGDHLDFQVVDRTSLTSVQLTGGSAREFEKPIDFVRVLPSPADQVLHTVNGWPASFTRQVGRGKILFTTLGARAWWDRPRAPGDPKSPFQTVPDLVISLAPQNPVADLAAQFRPRAAPHPFTDEDLRPILVEEIGYSIVSRSTAALIFGAFALALVALGIVLRRSRRPELAGWLGPVAALFVAAAFLAMGEGSRRAVPPTVAVAEVVDVVPGSTEASVSGLFAVYHPASGLVPVGTSLGGVLDLDVEGLEGQNRRLIQTDIDAWHWENLSLPAGVRSGPFRVNATTGRIAAAGRFGPDGLEGLLTTGPYRNPADAVIITPAAEPTGVRLETGGKFSSGVSDPLPAGQFLAGAVLSDQQQRRQAVYRKFLTYPLPEHLEGRNVLLAWAEPAGIPFTGEEGSRAAGSALLVVPLEFERAAAATKVTIPRSFVPYRRVLSTGLSKPTLDGMGEIDMRLRFQIPPSVLPMTIERATLIARVRAPGWRFAVSGIAGDKPVPLQAVESPVDPIRVEIADQQLLKLDETGGLHLSVALIDKAGASGENRWKIESITLELLGQTAAEK